ncbi:hypothetical protein [Rhodococcus sp. IEGM 1408]|uniref:hypothetical protein n=1 Tax=Rhodococcus sp. IEGM 1408 TaxID=3082220 RepID=UPI0029534E2C|nr:hypothetical protein [Rhodococcus sp. IEGM 1408]MDV8000003.1 hypothetical protein [Rhodococcus sp. IEGM 1408]
MTPTATDHISTRDVAAGRRGSAVIALAMAAGVALAGCSGGGEPEPATSPTTQVTTSSSSTPTSTPPATETVAAISVPTSTAAPAAPAPPPAPLPANVVGTGGPCQLVGDLAQADDGSPLFCLEDPGGAGPLWLPQPGAGPDGTGPGVLGRPCMQEGVGVTTPDGAVLTCRLTGGGDVPGGLYWQ